MYQTVIALVVVSGVASQTVNPTTSPSVSPTPLPTYSGVLEVTSGAGSCRVSAAGDCVADGDGSYGANAACTVQVNEVGTLNAEGVFDLQADAPNQGGAGSFQVTSGAAFCTVDSNGCVTDGPGYHGSNERCTIRVLRAGRLGTTGMFSTESGFDYLTINGQRYEGSSGPNNVAVAAGSSFTWYSDGSEVRTGWTVCLSGCADYIQVGSERYCGSTGPQSVTVAAGSSFSWRSDGSSSGAGWNICLRTTLQPTIAPTSSPTTSPSVSPTPLPTYSGVLEVTSGAGSCRVSAAGDCVTDGDGSYGANAACTVQVNEVGTLNAEGVFDVQAADAPNQGGAGSFRVTSGTAYCSVDSNGCVTDGPGNHGINERCTIQVLRAGRLSTVGTFRTEVNYDYLLINGQRYHGTSGPNNVAVAAGSIFSWQSDGSEVNTGWTVCLSGCADYIQVGSDRYCGSTGPQSVTVAAGSSFSWRSDGASSGSGWNICFQTAPTSAPTVSPTTSNPTTTPTLAPTSSPTTTNPTLSPTVSPTRPPTLSTPTTSPTISPTTSTPTSTPTLNPTSSPTTANPTVSPTVSPTRPPTLSTPTTMPTISPTTSTPTTAIPSTLPTTSAPTDRQVYAISTIARNACDDDGYAPILTNSNVCMQAARNIAGVLAPTDCDRGSCLVLPTRSMPFSFNSAVYRPGCVYQVIEEDDVEIGVIRFNERSNPHTSSGSMVVCRLVGTSSPSLPLTPTGMPPPHDLIGSISSFSCVDSLQAPSNLVQIPENHSPRSP